MRKVLCDKPAFMNNVLTGMILSFLLSFSSFSNSSGLRIGSLTQTITFLATSATGLPSTTCKQIFFL